MTDFDKDHVDLLIQDFVDAGLLSKPVAEAMSDTEKIIWFMNDGDNSQ